jgi:linoleoyl-CoA desaturase
VTSETEAVITLEPDMEDLVPSEASPRQSAGDRQARLPSRKSCAAASTGFLPTRTFLPKPTARCGSRSPRVWQCWRAAGLLSTRSRPDSWKFVALYLLGGLAQTFLLLNIAHDSNHNAISSCRPSTNPELCLRSLRNQLVHVAYPPSSRPPLLHQSPRRRRRAYGTRHLRFTPHEPRAPWHRFQHIYALFFYAMFSLDYVFVRDFECFFFPPTTI